MNKFNLKSCFISDILIIEPNIIFDKEDFSLNLIINQNLNPLALMAISNKIITPVLKGEL
jgi:hypothetical protein